MTSRPARIALIGDRSPQVLAHERIPVALRHATPDPDAVDPYWIASTEVADVPGLADFDGIWLAPGSPYADRDGVLHAAEVARTRGVPLLGTCGGFQHAVLEFARGALGLALGHAEYPQSDDVEALIVPLTCSLVGEEGEVDVVPGTAAAAILGAGRRVERYFCSYGLAERFRAPLEQAGLVFSATDPDGAVRMLELPGHPFFLGSLFQPELSSDRTWVHPLIRAFAAAAVRRAADRPVGAPATGDVPRGTVVSPAPSPG
jgi:CTP synthase (UTP-ammonia lyase)